MPRVKSNLLRSGYTASQKIIITHQKLGGLRILMAGVPCVSTRGYFGYCTLVLFRLNGDWALFDTGHYSDRHILVAALAKAGASADEIRHVVVSHLHFDHVLNLPLFKNAAIYITRAELDYADQVLAGKVEDHSIPDFWPSLLKNRQVRVVDDLLELSSRVSLVHLPGHTPGCLAMFCQGPSPWPFAGMSSRTPGRPSGVNS